MVVPHRFFTELNLSDLFHTHIGQANKSHGLGVRDRACCCVDSDFQIPWSLEKYVATKGIYTLTGNL